MKTILPILTDPDKRLRINSVSVLTSTLQLKRTQSLIDSMIATMYADDGIGLAAVQVNEPIRIIVIGKDALNDRQSMPFPSNIDIVLINPLLHKISPRTNWSEEGCLSVPGIYGDVERSLAVGVEALNRNGQPISFTAKNFFARVIQHEIDHLNGVLFIDHALNAHHIDRSRSNL